MKKHLFIGSFDFKKETVIIKDQELIKQIKNVLRFKIDDIIFLGNGQKTEAKCKILEITKNEITVKILNTEVNNNEYTKEVTLYLAILKRENFELVIQKATEVGIKTIVPVLSERTVKTGIKSERLEKIIKEASEQARRGIIPAITEAMKFNDAITHAQNNQTNLFFHLDGEKINDIKLDTNKIGIFIGPEGGWSDKEIAEIKKSDNFKKVSLGKLTLRGETAAIVACYITLNK
jgi:16S rRNA (uracil1498-N3)-methyltransferase